ncbi:ComEC/Rec2 family competence protein [Acidithiobacillus montserratensis]|uniref:ComEC/Rec2 family competence protein n=1 Tax=Acidithiobacillus montserratensis TaxID=2729135 RepID=A0ACD5HGT9_9PROT|nr:ComEC/Rec2 family competence protein [Acidithiobacillus montserratensis]
MRVGAMGYFHNNIRPSVAKLWPGTKSWPSLPLVVLAVGLGMGLFHCFRQLPPLWIPLSLTFMWLPLVWKWRPALLMVLTTAAFSWGIWQAELRLAVHWPLARNFTVEGRIVSIPQLGGREYRFQLAPEHWLKHAPGGARPAILQVHGSLPELPVVGQRWHLQLRSEALSSLPGSPFTDLARQRFWAGIGGVARIENARLLAPSFWSLGDHIAKARQAVLQATNMALDRESAGFVQALSVGVGNQLSPEIWNVYRDTGTAHLLVISGSHVAVVAGLFGWLLQWLWRRVPWLVMRWPAQTAGVLASIPAAWFYASFAGMQIPGERAAWMITAAAVSWLLGRSHRAWQGLALAGLLIVLFNPGAMVDVGFWLSLGAVAALIAVGYGAGGWRTLLRSQWAVFIALLPLLAALFGQISLVSPLANILVIPLVEMLAVPVALLGTLLALLDLELLSRVLFRVVALQMDGITALLKVLLEIPYAQLHTGTERIWAVLAAALGLSIFFLPSGWPGRSLAFLGLLPLLVPAAGGSDFELHDLSAQSGMVLFWQKKQHSGIWTANLWKAGARREAGQALAAVLQKKGLDKVSDWVRTDTSTPLPIPAAGQQWGPVGARHYPQSPDPLGVCRGGAGHALAGSVFVDLGKTVQPCILLWGKGPDLLILGDMDVNTLQRLASTRSSTLQRVQLVLAPDSLAEEERKLLASRMPHAVIHYAGKIPAGVWVWQNGHFRSAAVLSPAYWQVRD